MRFSLRLLLILVIVIGLPVTSYLWLFRPANRDIDANREDLKHREALLVRLTQETAKNDDLAKANDDLKEQIKLIEARLPSGKEIDGLVRQVSDLAIQSGLNPPAIKSLKAVPAAQYLEQPMAVEVSGDFVGFFTFIAQIEKLPRITRIHDLKITGQGDGVTDSDKPELTAEFNLSIYFQDELRPAAPAPGTPIAEAK
jgi:type IV pilus assembly protein PilO